MAFKSLADPSFEYRSAANTDVRITFERARRELEEARRQRERETDKGHAIAQDCSMQAGTSAAEGGAPH